jgi:hypothetical protein
MADWQNLYRWEPGYEPDWVAEARREKIAVIRACQRLAREKAEAEAIRLAREVSGEIDSAALEAIGKECKLGPLILKRVLASVGYEIKGPQKHSGYPVSWPHRVRECVAGFVRGKIKKGDYGDDWLSIDAIVVALGRQHTDIFDYLSSRGVRIALEAEGFTTVRRAEGRGIVGYKLQY